MSTKATDRPLFLSLPKAAEIIGVLTPRLKRAIEAQQIPAIMVGKRWLVPRAVLEKLASGETASALAAKGGDQD
ncbi:MAG: helix-turn-helix domain-containing protein [Candidatus Binataceae bacterium]